MSQVHWDTVKLLSPFVVCVGLVVVLAFAIVTACCTGKKCKVK